MAESKSVNADRSRKRVEATSVITLKRPKNTYCEVCYENKMFVETTNEYIAKTLEERTELMRVKKAKNERDPSKKPLTPFFHFMEDFRKSFNKANPDNKKVSVVGREGGEKWRAMSEEEKKPYTEKAAKQQAAHDEYWRIQLHDSPTIRKKRRELREAEEEAEEALMMDEEWFIFHYKG
ncbi:uncharacterized protein LOC143541636 [Bidens hawaiensis]|uniref:uncharacterized protein LOC143541636 n=1 Tax=Bidens hawaiensis TaxID=980011 RepID=UPI00404B45D8